MKKKKIIILILSIIAVIGILTGYLFLVNYRADYYAKVSRETPNTQDKIIALEKSTALYSKQGNVLSLADLYISIGKSDLAEKIMLGRGEVDILNKLGNLYLTENKTKEAENTFTKAKNKKLNSDTLKGLILVELKKGDRGVAENWVNELSHIDRNSASCYRALVNLNDFNKAKSEYVKTNSCALTGLNTYFSKYKESENPSFLKLESVNLYYSEGFIKIAENDILALLKEKGDYRDAETLASKIYASLEDTAKAQEHKAKAAKIDPAL